MILYKYKINKDVKGSNLILLVKDVVFITSMEIKEDINIDIILYKMVKENT